MTIQLYSCHVFVCFVKLQALIDENETAIEEEKLPREDFVLDMDQNRRLKASLEAAVSDRQRAIENEVGSVTFIVFRSMPAVFFYNTFYCLCFKTCFSVCHSIEVFFIKLFHPLRCFGGIYRQFCHRHIWKILFDTIICPSFPFLQEVTIRFCCLQKPLSW